METWTTPRGKERNCLEGDDEGSALPVSERLQSPLVITGPDGKIMTWDTPQKKFVPWSAISKLQKSRVKQQLLRSRECDSSSCSKPNPGIPSQFVIAQPGCLTPQSSRTNGLLATPRRQFWTPGRPPKTPLGPEYAATPITPPSKARPPMSSCRKPQSKSRMKLRMLDDQELQASRVVQARQDLLMERQERAFTAWLNHVFDLLPTGGSQVSNVEDSVSRKYSVTSLCSNSSLLSTDVQLIDEADYAQDYVASPFRDPTYPCRSLRSPLAPLNGVGNRGLRSVGVVNSDKRVLKDVFSTPDGKSNLQQSLAGLQSSSKKLRMMAEPGYSYSRNVHMQDVGRINELARRLKLHFGETETGEILAVITQLAKHIDEGRLRMKKGCVLLTDVALRKKAIQVLLNYNACWMRIGLHAVLGHTALLGERLHQDGSKQTVHKDVQEAQFARLKVFIKKHFFAHPDQASESATKKATEGFYRDEHSETLGRAILKRFFLLVLVLDKLKCQTTLRITDGIDGVDGGSPPLFRSDATPKSSRQVLQEFLSGVMHGEGDLIENLGAFGYHVHHHQVPLADYDFAVVNLIEDLQDGVRLCRLVQLLAKNDSRMLEHIRVPSNGRKRQLHNCQIALEGLASAGVPLEDEDGRSINAEDIINGNKDKVFSLLWNIMVHLQIPVLVSRARLCQEIAKLQGTEGRVALGLNVGTVELLLKWTQVTCMISGNFSVRNFKSSFGDGHAFFLILKLYLPHLLLGNAQLLPACPSHFEEQIGNTPDGKVTFSSTHKKVVAHNFGLVQDVARKLGSIPEVLQLEDVLVYPEISERNIVVFIAFLCSFLLKDNALVLNTQKPRRISQDADANHRDDEQLRCGSQRKLESESPRGFNRFYSVDWRLHEARCGTMLPEVCNSKSQVNENSQRILSEDIVGKVCKIQSWWRACSVRPHVSSHQRTAQKIQIDGHRVSAHLKRAHSAALRIQAHWRGFVVRRMLKRWTASAAVIQLRYRAMRNHTREQAAHVLQCCFRAWAQKRKYRTTVSNMCKIQAFWWANQARGNFEREQKAVHTIESEWLHYIARRRSRRSVQIRWPRSASAQLIQAHWRGYITRRILMKRSSAALIIQSWVRGHFQRREYQRQKQRIQVQAQTWIQNEYIRRIQHTHVARIQACWRRRVVKRQFKEAVRAAKTIQGAWRFLKALRKRQSFYRAMKVESSTRIQARWRGLVARRKQHLLKQAATKIQRAWRQRKRELTERALKVISSTRIQARWRGLVDRRKLFLLKQAATKIQRAWRQRERELTDRATKIISSTRIQARWRGLVDRRKLFLLKQAATKIQRAWRQRKRELTDRATKVISSTRIQARWRGLVDRRKLFLLKQAATKIQRAWRQRKRELTDRATKVTSSTRIQARWRGLVDRRKLFLLKQAAAKIQKAWRQRNRELTDRATKVISSTRIQAWWRGLVDRRKLYLLKQAATKIQRAWRQRERELADIATKVDSSTRIQTWWRGLVARRKLFLLKQAATKIQAWWRKHGALQQFEIQNHAARKIQRKWRHWVAWTRNRYVSAPVIQRRGRDHFDPAIYSTFEDSALARQSCQYGHIRRKRFQRVLRIRHRAYAQRIIREVNVASSRVIEDWWRAQSRRRQSATQIYFCETGICDGGATRMQADTVQDQRALLCRLLSAVEFQTISKKRFKLGAADHSFIVLLKIKSFCGVQEQCQQHEAELLCQASGPESRTETDFALEHENMESGACLEGKEKADSANLHVYKESPCSCDIFECRYRGATYTTFILMPTSPTVTIQMEVWKQDGKRLLQQLAPDGPSSARAICRTFHSEGCDLRFLAAARSKRRGDTERVDNLTRCLSGRNVLDLSSLACNTLSPKELNAAHVISSWFQTFAQRANYLRLRSCVVVIQRHIRGRINRSRFAHMKAFAILVQAHWRGYLVRRGQSHPENPLRELREKIRTNAVGVQDNARIYNRLAEALSTLPHQETVSGILSTCRTIDVATEHSYNCCEHLAEAGAITTILLLIQTINRSPPLEQVLKHALSILSNLARYSPLATRVAQSPSAISIISEQLHTYRNDEGIFLQAMSVLQMVCKTSAGVEVLQSDRSIARRLLLIAQSLEGNIQAEKRTVEALPRATPAAMQRKSAHTKMREAIYKFLSTVGLMNDVNGLLHYRTATATTPLRRQHTVRLVAHTCPDAKRVGNTKFVTTARQVLSPRNGRSF